MKSLTPIYLLTAGLLSTLALGAPTTSTTSTTTVVEERGVTRGCTGGHYYVKSGGYTTLYACRGGCTTDGRGQPRCDNGVSMGSWGGHAAEAAPFAVHPVNRARDDGELEEA